MKSISAIHPAIMENTENMLVKRVPHISIRESHNTSISAMSNSHSKCQHTSANKLTYCICDMHMLCTLIHTYCIISLLAETVLHIGQIPMLVRNKPQKLWRSIPQIFQYMNYSPGLPFKVLMTWHPDGKLIDIPIDVLQCMSLIRNYVTA